MSKRLNYWNFPQSFLPPYHLSQITTPSFRCLYVILESSFSFTPHVQSVSSCCWHYLLSLYNAYNFVLNYCSRFQIALLTSTHISPKSDLNLASCRVLLTLKTDRTPLLKTFRWLPISFRVKDKALNGLLSTL